MNRTGCSHRVFEYSSGEGRRRSSKVDVASRVLVDARYVQTVRVDFVRITAARIHHPQRVNKAIGGQDEQRFSIAGPSDMVRRHILGTSDGRGPSLRHRKQLDSVVAYESVL